MAGTCDKNVDMREILNKFLIKLCVKIGSAFGK